jgi:hypothetical protein
MNSDWDFLDQVEKETDQAVEDETHKILKRKNVSYKRARSASMEEQKTEDMPSTSDTNHVENDNHFLLNMRAPQNKKGPQRNQQGTKYGGQRNQKESRRPFPRDPRDTRDRVTTNTKGPRSFYQGNQQNKDRREISELLRLLRRR